NQEAYESAQHPASVISLYWFPPQRVGEGQRNESARIHIIDIPGSESTSRSRIRSTGQNEIHGDRDGGLRREGCANGGPGSTRRSAMRHLRWHFCVAIRI